MTHESAKVVDNFHYLLLLQEVLSKLTLKQNTKTKQKQVWKSNFIGDRCRPKLFFLPPKHPAKKSPAIPTLLVLLSTTWISSIMSASATPVD